MSAPSKMDLLNRYMAKPVRRFLQIDGHANVVDDDVMSGDVDGDSFSYGTRWELRQTGSADLPLRILIHEDADPEATRRLLIKAVRLLDQSFEELRTPQSDEAPF